ncbi:MAG: hypothetical protein BIFFINMI_03514 [Phycisphaerae bacterium]|nr:hypothetical protein [Phycisphaerae bacterium]
MRAAIHVAVSLLLMAGLARGEDFSVHIERLADLDNGRPAPQLAFDRDRVRPDTQPDGNMPENRFDVYARFKDFGRVRLGETLEAGPSAGGHWPRGKVFKSGLVDTGGIKSGWVRNAPDLFIIAWTDEPDGRGNEPVFHESMVLLRLADGRAAVLMRASRAMNVRRQDMGYPGLESAFYSFDKAGDLLVERVTRTAELGSDRPGLLLHRERGPDGRDAYSASIHETVLLCYRYADGRLTPCKADLTYRAQAGDDLADIARFYLGPFADARNLLVANRGLFANLKIDADHPSARLSDGQAVDIPVPDERLFRQYSGELAVPADRHGG